jgi:hypothetical protein
VTSMNGNVILIRGLDVTTRLPDQVLKLSEHAAGGLLLETLIGRYVLDRDARMVWMLIDGRRTVDEVVNAVGTRTGLPTSAVCDQVYGLCARLLELGLVGVATDADTTAVSAAIG